MKKTLIKKLWNNYKNLLLTLICAITVIITLYILNEVAPFGKYSMLAVDFYHQYGPMMGELFDRVKNSSNFIYSFNMGMGLPFFRNYFNYMSSFFNIILFFVKRENLLASYSVIIGLKAVVSAVTMNIFLNYKFKKKSYIHSIIAIIYAFNNYFTAYYWNIMWLDGLVLLPIVVMGIEKLIEDDKYYLYIFSLACMLFSNYFIGFMLCIFSVIYFLIYLFIIKDKLSIKIYLEKCLKFGICSLLAGGLCAFALIPMFKSLSGISATSDIWPSNQYYSFTLIEFIYNHLSGVPTTVFKSDAINAPNISSSIIVLPLFILFLLNKDIKLRVKIGYSLMLGIMVLSFFWAPLDFIWHAFHVPNDLPYRYSFIYPFIFLIISTYSIYKIDKVKEYIVIIIFVLTLLFAGSVHFIKSFNILDTTIVFNFIIVILWFLLYIIYKFFNDKSKFIPFIGIIVVCLEAIISINGCWDIDQDLKGFYSDYNKIKNNLNYIKNNDTDLFYRIEKKDMKTFNDPSWYGYYGITAFSSMEYENLAVLEHNLGMPGNQINSFSLGDNTPIYNIMFNLKYIVGDMSDNNNYDLYFTDAINDNYVYKSKYYAGLMYKVNKDIVNWDFFSDNPFENQNNFIKQAYGINDILVKNKINNDSIVKFDNEVVHKYKMNKNEGYIYLGSNINSVIIDKVLYVNDGYTSGIDSSFDYNTSLTFSENKIIHYSNCDTIYISYNNEIESYAYIYYVDNDKLKNINEMVNNNLVKLSNFDEYKISGKISGLEGTIYTSIPYDEGWDVYIDGERTNTFLIGNSLLGFDINDGDHEITLVYKIPYFKTGLGISIGSLSVIIGYAVLKKKKLIR